MQAVAHTMRYDSRTVKFPTLMCKNPGPSCCWWFQNLSPFGMISPRFQLGVSTLLNHQPDSCCPSESLRIFCHSDQFWPIIFIYFHDPLHFFNIFMIFIYLYAFPPQRPRPIRTPRTVWWTSLSSVVGSRWRLRRPMGAEQSSRSWPVSRALPWNFRRPEYGVGWWLTWWFVFCENKESHQRGSHQLGNKLKQIINHFETLDFIKFHQIKFQDNHVSYLFLGQTWCDICCGPGSHCGPKSTSPSHTFWCDIVLHCLSGQCNKSIKRLTMYWNTLLSSNWLWRTVLVLFKHVLYIYSQLYCKHLALFICI